MTPPKNTKVRKYKNQEEKFTPNNTAVKKAVKRRPPDKERGLVRLKIRKIITKLRIIKVNNECCIIKNLPK